MRPSPSGSQIQTMTDFHTEVEKTVVRVALADAIIVAADGAAAHTGQRKNPGGRGGGMHFGHQYLQVELLGGQVGGILVNEMRYHFIPGISR